MKCHTIKKEYIEIFKLVFASTLQKTYPHKLCITFEKLKGGRIKTLLSSGNILLSLT